MSGARRIPAEGDGGGAPPANNPALTHPRARVATHAPLQPNGKRRWERHGFTEGHAVPPEYKAWGEMLARCYRPGTASYRWHGARGITVCLRWRESFAAFYADVGPRPGAGYSLDRIDTNGHYEPGNVRWATWTQQQRNRRSNRLLSLGGETLPMAAWAERYGLKSNTVRCRLKRGWDLLRALTTPAGGAK